MQLCVRPYLAQALKEAHAVGSGQRPAAEHAPASCKRPCNADFHALAQRQCVVLIFEQHNRLARDPPRCGAVLRTQQQGFFLLRVGVLVRVLKQTERVFQGQNAPYGFIHCLPQFRELAHELFAVLKDTGRHHLHVDPGLERLFGRFALVRARAVGQRFIECAVVGDDDAVKTVFFPQNPAQQRAVYGGRNAIHRIEGGHGHTYARTHRSQIRGQIVFAQHALGQVDRVIVTSRLGSAVCRKVLDARRHMARPDHARLLVFLSLIAANHRRSHLPVEPRILAG